MIGRRSSDISCNEEEFDKAKVIYEAALKNSGYKCQLEYRNNSTSTNKPNRRQRSRKIIWFHPPYSSHVTTNIGRKFFKLLENHFPVGNRLHKLFNRNTVKISYSCLQNMGSVLKSTRQEPSEGQTTEEKKTCNCRKPNECPMDGNCLKSAVVYEATISTSTTRYDYIGLTEETFKKRYSSHATSFRHEKLMASTELSKKVWELKNSDTPYDIKWRIIKTAYQYKGGGRTCDLCLTEKLLILMHDSSKGILLNKRRELISKCRHVNKFRLQKCIN